MLRGTDNFALNFGLLVSPDLIKPVTPASVLYYVTEHGGLLGHETAVSTYRLPHEPWAYKTT